MFKKKYLIIIYLLKLISSETCVNPVLNCVDCDSLNNCISCIQGYHLNQQNCIIDIQNCLIYKNDTTCETCVNNHVLQDNQCYLRITNCLQYTNNTTCETCVNNHVLQDNQCYLRITNCLLYNNYTTCKTCVNNHVLQDNQCYLRITNCLQYTQQICTICDNYYISNEQNCIPWVQNCLKYISTSIQPSYMCENCIDGHYLSDNTCQNCSQSFFGCLDCTPTYCLQCIGGYYLDVDTKYCQMCNLGCLECISNMVCTNCIIDYYINFQYCLPCNQSIPGCISCSQSQICDLCGVGYQQQDNKCIQCNNLFPHSSECNQTHNMGCQEYYFLHNNLCLFCSQYCLTCETQIKCLKCQNNTVTHLNQCFTYDSGLVQLEWIQNSQELLHFFKYQLKNPMNAVPTLYFCQYQSDCGYNGSCKKNYCECNSLNFGLRCQFTYDSKDIYNNKIDSIIDHYTSHQYVYDQLNCTTLGLFFLDLAEIAPIMEFERIYQIGGLVLNLSEQCPQTYLQLIDVTYRLIQGIQNNQYISFLDKQAGEGYCMDILGELKKNSILKIQSNQVQQYSTHQVQINLISVDAKNGLLLKQILDPYLKQDSMESCDYIRVLKTPTLYLPPEYLESLQQTGDQIRFYSENNFYNITQGNTASVRVGFFFSNSTPLLPEFQDFILYIPKRDLVNRYSFNNFNCLQEVDQGWRELPALQNCQNYIICSYNQLGTFSGQVVQKISTNIPVPLSVQEKKKDRIADQAGFGISMGLFWTYIFFLIILIRCYFKEQRRKKSKRIMQEMTYLPPKQYGNVYVTPTPYNYNADMKLTIKQKMELSQESDPYPYPMEEPPESYAPKKRQYGELSEANIWMIFPMYNITHTQQLGHRFQKLSFFFINMLIFLSWTCIFIGGGQANPTLGMQLLCTILPFPLTWMFSYIFGFLCSRLRWHVDDRFSVNPVYWVIHIVMFSGLGCLNTFLMYDSSQKQDIIVVIAFFVQFFVDFVFIDLVQVYIAYLILRQNEDSYQQLVNYLQTRGYID